MAPFSLAVRQEVLRVTEVACVPQKFELRPPGSAVRICVESGPAQTFTIRNLEDENESELSTPLIPAGEEYLW